MKSLYPPLEPVRVHHLNVDPPHCIYVEECGNSNGIPVVFLHGGPGSGAKPYHRQFFDPQHYRIIIFDQRGTGRSVPAGEVNANTTQALIADMEEIRKMLAIDRWVLFGGSWGVTLALAYAEAYPLQVSGMVLRGSFMATQAEVDWVFRDGVHRIFPDAWERFSGHIPEAERGDLVRAYHKRIMSDSRDENIAAVREWANWTGRVVTYLLPEVDSENNNSSKQDSAPQVSDSTMASMTVESHYTANRYFLEDGELMANINCVPDVPVSIIHGRRDLTCTLDTAWALHNALPQSTLEVLPESGHLASEPAMIDALVRATDAIRSRL